MECIPIFRRAARDERGRWVTHPTEFLTYAQYAEDEHRLCRAFGLKDDGGTYKYRKGHAASIAGELSSFVQLETYG